MAACDLCASITLTVIKCVYVLENKTTKKRLAAHSTNHVHSFICLNYSTAQITHSFYFLFFLFLSFVSENVKESKTLCRSTLDKQVFSFENSKVKFYICLSILYVCICMHVCMCVYTDIQYRERHTFLYIFQY